MDPATAAKIRTHKFGRRKLASDSAWTRYNKLVKDENNASIIEKIASDTVVQTIIDEMNESLRSALAVGGFTSGDIGSKVIDITAPDNMFIPRSVWYGYIDYPTGDFDTADRALFQAKEADFADKAGLLRARIARIYQAAKVVNDMRNDDVKPNPGGVVGREHLAH